MRVEFGFYAFSIKPFDIDTRDPSTYCLVAPSVAFVGVARFVIFWEFIERGPLGAVI